MNGRILEEYLQAAQNGPNRTINWRRRRRRRIIVGWQCEGVLCFHSGGYRFLVPFLQIFYEGSRPVISNFFFPHATFICLLCQVGHNMLYQWSAQLFVVIAIISWRKLIFLGLIKDPWAKMSINDFCFEV